MAEEKLADGGVLAAAQTVRRKKGISLDQIADLTKIAIRSLRAIEEGDFAKLPGGIYNISYIRQYARVIDFDEVELLACYYRRMGIPPPKASPEVMRAGAHERYAFKPLRQPTTAVGSLK